MDKNGYDWYQCADSLGFRSLAAISFYLSCSGTMLRSGSYLTAHVPLVVGICADPVVPRSTIQVPIFGMLPQTCGEITDRLPPPRWDSGIMNHVGRGWINRIW